MKILLTLTEQGRPVLVGTTSVEISELLGTILRKRGIKHNVLNAKMHQREADIVAEAGNKQEQLPLQPIWQVGVPILNFLMK